ncbi:MAG: hypothetical protein ACRDK8_08640 [Solirubrobacteraceae bacterium]
MIRWRSPTASSTAGGRDTVALATAACERAETELLASLTPQQGERLRDTLQAIVAGEGQSIPAGSGTGAKPRATKS